MKTIVKNISLLLCVVAVLASCKRKPISEDCICDTQLSIPVDINWEPSGITLQNVTILFYDSEDGSLLYEHKYEHNDNDTQSYVYLPVGSYTAVVFNELRNQIDYLSCVGYDNISTLKFESNDDENTLRSRLATRSYVEQPGDLAVAVVEEVEVTQDMILEAAEAAASTKALSSATRSTVESLTGIVPVKKNTTINITAHFDNIYYARMPALVDLVNLADGYYVYADQNSNTTSTLQFTMNNRTYDEDSEYNGTISASVTTFGTLIDRTSTSGHDELSPIMLDVLFQLIDYDATEVSYAVDVTDIISIYEYNNSIYMDIDAVFPEVLPEVNPDVLTEDSGFGSSLEEWKDQEVLL